MTIEKERLLSLIEYAQQSARFRTDPVSTITQHNQFTRYEHKLRDHPGISLNIEKGEGQDEVWLPVKRFHELGIKGSDPFSFPTPLALRQQSQ